MDKKAADAEMNLSYEEAIKRLEEITNLLEQGDAALDESLQLFQEGMELAKFCELKLNSMEEEIKKFQLNSEDEPQELEIDFSDE